MYHFEHAVSVTIGFKMTTHLVLHDKKQPQTIFIVLQEKEKS